MQGILSHLVPCPASMMLAVAAACPAEKPSAGDGAAAGVKAVSPCAVGHPGRPALDRDYRQFLPDCGEHQYRLPDHRRRRTYHRTGDQRLRLGNY
jgi:hypothetical protein